MTWFSEVLKKNGVIVCEDFYPQVQISQLHKIINDNIKKCANELNCNLENYLTNVSRWLSPSPVTNGIDCQLMEALTVKLCNLLETEIKLIKMNVISKSMYANNPIPCHQDFPYSPETPYEFSVWLPLSDVSEEDGVLEFLPGSHLNGVAPAVDFWQPDFIDKMHSSKYWQENHIALPVKAGAAIFFDSRIWHRSSANTSTRNRFVIVTRWLREKHIFHEKIPAIPVHEFGMWTCGKRTKQLLQQGLLACFDLHVEADLENYINIWQRKLKKNIVLPFRIEVGMASKALNNLLILHKASKLHNGGDAQGIVYANLWRYFLQALSQWLIQYEKINMENT